MTTKRHDLIDSAIALLAPRKAKLEWANQEVKEKLLNGELLRYAVLSREHFLDGLDLKDGIQRWPAKGYFEGAIGDLADLAVHIAVPSKYISELAEDAAATVKSLATRLNGKVDAKTMSEIADFLHQPKSHCLTVAVCIWLNAFVMHRRIAFVHEGISSPHELKGADPQKPLLHSQVLATWRKILEINYGSVFEPAEKTMDPMGRIDASVMANIIGELDVLAEKIDSIATGPLIDISGELFPKLSANRKETASFYTLPETAELLATLSRPEQIASIEDGPVRVADFACGTGTLLRAAYRQIQTQYERAGKNARSYHKQWMENGLYGMDIQPIAKHLTAAGLTGMGIGEIYERSNLVYLSAKEGKIGSLQLLEENVAADLFATSVQSDFAKSNKSNKSQQPQSVTAADSTFDWIIMNPPYSRTRGKQRTFDQKGVPVAHRNRSQNYLSKLLVGTFANGRAGLASAFSVLADRKLREGGTLSFVYPLTAASADSWKEFRLHIGENYKNICAIAIANSAHNSFSADTGMAEMLLISQKLRKHEKPDDYLWNINLHSAPTNLAEAAEFARAITKVRSMNPDKEFGWLHLDAAGIDEIGSWSKHFFDENRDEPWGGLGCRSEIAITARELSKGFMHWPGESQRTAFSYTPMSIIGELFSVGATHDLIGHLARRDPRGAYEFRRMRENEIDPRPSLWAADAKAQCCMLVKPTHKGTMVRAELAEQMWKQASDLFWSRTLSMSSQKIQSAMTENKAMGGRAFVSLQHPVDGVRQLACLWGNSIFGLLTMWWHGQKTHYGRATAQIGAIKSLPIPNFSDLCEAYEARVGEKFAELKTQPLLAIARAWKDPARKEIDKFVAEMLGIETTPEKMDLLRRLWCEEPTVNGGNKKIVDELKGSNQVD